LGTEVVVVGGAIDVEVVVEVVFAGEGSSEGGFTVVVAMGFMVILLCQKLWFPFLAMI